MSKVLAELLKDLPQTSVLNSSFSKDDYVKLDLSSNNIDLRTFDLSSSEILDDYITGYRIKNKAKIAYGGYLEKRNIYNRSSHFKPENKNNERNIHLGLDLWLETESPIFAPLDGIVHSCKNNENFGDYGPTIILKHVYEQINFYTLYGHLSIESISDLMVGQQITKGQLLATLGTPEINGDYAPHLHFQIIKDIENYIGDYPGVCSEDSLDFYAENCIDPNILLRL